MSAPNQHAADTDRRIRRPGRVCLAASLALASLGAAGPATAQEIPSAAIVMYHQFGEPERPSTNILIEQFEAQIEELTAGGYTVLPLPEIVGAFRAGTPLPERTVGITIDDAYLSVYLEAWPRLRAADLPFTLFVATGPVDEGYADFMSWDQIRELAAAGVTIGHHTVSHRHMAGADLALARREIAAANERFEAELGFRPTLFAYPYGEYGLALRDLVAESGYQAAFGQQSGAAHAGGDIFALPRFPLNERFGDMERFRLIVNVLALPADSITPRDPLLHENPPAFGFTVDPEVGGLDALACYESTGTRPSVERLGESRFEVRFAGPFPRGRGRVNCTAPGPDGRWRWFGMQFYVE